MEENKEDIESIASLAENIQKKAAKKKEKVPKTPEEIEKARKKFSIDSANKAKQFAMMAKEKYGGLISAILVFGSFTRSDFVGGSDVDVHVIFDDTKTKEPLGPEARELIYKQLCDMGAKLGKDPHVHVQFATLTEFLDGIRTANPITFNFVRNGRAILDNGFFKPLKKMLYLGLIRPGDETVIQTLNAALDYWIKIRTYREWCIERMYRAVTLSLNSLLMAAGLPPVRSDEMVPALQNLISQKIIEPEYLKIFQDITSLFESIERSTAQPFTFDLVVEYFRQADKFVSRMEAAVKDYVSGKFITGDKVSTHPKLFWINKDQSRGYVWLLENSIFMALYAKDQKEQVFKANIENNKLGELQPSTTKELVSRIEATQFKPLINLELIMIIIEKVKKELHAEPVQFGVEYTGRALIDLTPPSDKVPK